MRREKVTVEVVIAHPKRQLLRRVELPAGSTVLEAVSASGLADAGVAASRFGIYGKVVPAGTTVRDGDRVEIYRPLRADPKELRRLRAAAKR